MGKLISILITIGIIPFCGQMVSAVFSEMQQMSSPLLRPPPYVEVNEFISKLGEFDSFQGELPILRIKRTFDNTATVQEFTRRFRANCLQSESSINNTQATINFPCGSAVKTLGAVGSGLVEEVIFEYLRENRGSNPSARKAGIIALGFLGNNQNRKNGGTIPPEDGPVPQTVNAAKEIVNCLPTSLRPTKYSQRNQLTLCDSVWKVKDRNNRDEIRWGLVSLALTGSTEAQEVLENLKGNSAEGTSRQAFVKELLKLHKKASKKNGLLCLNDPENSACQ